MRLAPNAAGLSPQNTHRLPQLASTCWAKTCCPTRAAASRMRSVSGSGHPLAAGWRAILLAQFGFQCGDVEFLLPEQGQLAAVLDAQEIWQPAADPLGAGGGEQQPVGAAEPGRVVAEDGPGEHVPAPAVRTGTVQVGHFRQHTGRRPGEQAGQGWHRLGCPVRGRAAEMAVVNHKEAARQSSVSAGKNVAARRDRAARQQRPDLLARLAIRQLQKTGEVSHDVRLLPALIS